jgi:heme/copper-type cytochrome/quinol oxidase subunit 2
MKRFAFLVTALLCLMLPATAMAAAYNPLSSACGSGGGAASSTACGTNGSDPIDGPNGVIEKVTIIIASISGIVAVVIIVIAGFMFVLSNGDAQKAASARMAIIGALVGLVIIAAATSIITFVVGKI